MRKISCTRHRFPPEIIQRAIRLYFRFPLSFRDVEEMMAERGIEVSYETVRRWVLRFGPAFAANIKASRPRPSGTAHGTVQMARLDTAISVRSRRYLQSLQFPTPSDFSPNPPSNAHHSLCGIV